MTIKIINADVFDGLGQLEDESVHCVVTSPPYWGLRDYGIQGQIGMEPTFQEHVEILVKVFAEVRRVLRKDGTLWLNYGDAYCSTDKWGGGVGGNTGKQTVKDGSVPSWAVRAKKQPQPGIKPKDLMLMPARLAIALQEDGWWVRSEIVWHKPNPMPESVTDRPTSAHEKIWLLSRSPRYFYDAAAIRENCAVPSWDDGTRVFGGSNKHWANIAHGHRTTGRLATARKRGHHRSHDGFNGDWDLRSKAEQQANGRNIRNVWTIATAPFPEAHFATFPVEIAERCIKAGCPAGGTVLDPFGGSGTTGLVADRLSRDAILIELNPKYAEMARGRTERDAGLFASVYLQTNEATL
jgi:DNA modification methylase